MREKEEWGESEPAVQVLRRSELAGIVVKTNETPPQKAEGSAHHSIIQGFGKLRKLRRSGLAYEG